VVVVVAVAADDVDVDCVVLPVADRLPLLVLFLSLGLNNTTPAPTKQPR